VRQLQRALLQPLEPMSQPLPARQLTLQLTCRHGARPCTASSSQPRPAVLPSCAGRPAPGRRADSLRVSAARQGQGYTRYSDSYVLVDPNPGYVPEVQAEQQRLGWVQNLLSQAAGLLLSMQQLRLVVLLRHPLLRRRSGLTMVAGHSLCGPGWRWAWSWPRWLGRSGGCSPAAQQ